MKTILFFTNQESLTKIDFSDKKTPELSPQVIFNFNNKNMIILVKDDINLDQFKNDVWNNIKDKTTEFSYVYHRLPTDDVKLFLNDNKDCICITPIKGMHEEDSEESKIYLSIQEMVEAKIFTDLKNSFFDKIWKKFEETNQKDEALDLLHNILNGEVIKAEDLSPELKKQFKAHYNITEPYIDKHESKLIALRDEILKEKLANQN